MKLFRNPVVVGLLAIVALAMVGRNAILPLFRSKPRASAPAEPSPMAQFVQQAADNLAAAPAPRSAVASPKELSAQNMPLEKGGIPTTKPHLPDAKAGSQPLDLATIQLQAPAWAQKPRHDPFEIRALPSSSTNRLYPSAMELLYLSAIWRQSDSTLAVLNKRVYTAGDSILRFTIKSIEADRVWVQGPNGRESVDFRSVQPTRRKSSEKPPADPNATAINK